ncbi:MAG: sterol desaturase family protein [Solirubrobacteraceae bacterium]
MIATLTTFATTVPGLFILQSLGGLALYFGLSAFDFVYFFVLRRQRYFGPPEKEPEIPEPDVAEIRKAQKLAIYGTIGNAILATPILWLVAHGHSRVYYNVADRGWGYLILSALLFLVITETMIYWIHRGLHHGYFYEHLHLYHHEYRKVTPWVSMAFHPLDSFSQAVPHYLCIFLFPVHFGVYAVFLGGVMLWTFSIHDRVSWVRHPLVNYAAHHTMHHLYNKYNFGQFLTVWDRIGGTHRDPMKETRYVVLYPHHMRWRP